MKLIPVALSIAAAAISASATAEPVHDPLVAYAQRLAGSREFYVNTETQHRVFESATPRNVRLCVPAMSKTEIGVPPSTTPPVEVTWDRTHTSLVHPGDCVNLQAKQVSVGAASPLPDDVSLRGTIEMRPANARS